MTSDLNFKPAHELAALIRAKQLSPVELLEACLARIDETNPTLNAWTGMRPEEAMQEARDLEQRLARGEDAGPLAGLPFGVKELDDLAGFPSTHGSLPYKDNYPERDSIEVERLRQAGAIALGKTNAPEFGYTAFTKNLIFGVTRNPWNPERTPGGSSGGSSAAVAAGQVPFCTASDGGGSIRIPASWTGCFGMKVSFGRVPIGPRKMLGWNDTSVHGPMVRTVRDAALYMDAVAGTHEADPNSLPHPGYKYADVLERLPQGLRVAWSPDLGYAAVEADVLRECTEGARAFEKLGHRIDEVHHVFDDTGLIWGRVSGAEVWAMIHEKVETHREEFGRSFLRGCEMTKDITPEKYGMAQRVRAKLVNQLWEFFENYDLLLTPTLPIEAIDARGAWPTKIAGKDIENPLHVVAFTYPFNLSGHPAATVRTGFSDNGLPVGLQIVGPRHRDDLVLQAAYAFEQARPWNDRWPVQVPAFAG
ncbi:MAG: amidase [Dehalococcoidia bacterium]|nr:amidase [Dehalococcoidia bacterium]